MHNYGEQNSSRREFTPNTNIRNFMPIIPKKGVFNEWGAVLRNKDEMDREMDRQESLRRKQQREEYRKSLENQIKHQKNSYYGQASSNLNHDQSFLKDQWNREQNFKLKEQSENEKKKQLALNMAKDNLQNISLHRQQDSAVKRAENELFRNHMMMTEREDHQRAETNRAMRLQAQTKLRQTLDQQMAFKDKEKYNLKLHEKEIVKLGEKKAEEQEEQRLKFFDKLKQFQDQNAHKVESLKKYIGSDPRK